MDLFGWLFDFLSQIVCWIESGAITAFNLVIAGLGFVVGNTVGLMPDVPAYPDVPSWFTNAASWVAWVFPVHQAVLVFGFILAAWLVWLGVSTVLHWAKAL